MNMKEEAKKIYQSNLSNSEKIKALKDCELDCSNQMEAQDQNMNPELKHRLSEGLRKVRDYLRALQN